MTPDPTDDPLISQLAALQPSASDPSRSQRTLARCHAALARQHERNSTASATRLWWHAAEPVLLAAGCLAYVSDLVRRALNLH